MGRGCHVGTGGERVTESKRGWGETERESDKAENVFYLFI